MHQKKGNKAYDDKAVGKPAEKAFVQSPLEKNQVNEEGADHPEERAAEQGSGNGAKGGENSLACGRCRPGGLQTLGKPAGEAVQYPQYTDSDGYTQQYFENHGAFPLVSGFSSGRALKRYFYLPPGPVPTDGRKYTGFFQTSRAVFRRLSVKTG
jgi:hypothetical protein